MTLELAMRQGDVPLAGSHTVMHGRTELEDAPDPCIRRLMLRLRLTIPNGRPLPPHDAATRECARTYGQRMPARVDT